ncbi:double-stranded RNA-binding protein 1, partial [Phtheirospermum japonicum]
GVSNCYVFKSRLQEYCQKAGVTTPVYETIKEGPSHEPYFRSTVIVNNVRYDSLPGFFNRKAAEQSAAEVALVELGNSTDMKFGIAQPVQETGLCKNLLQEYAQKMNYAIPLYECHKDEKGRMSMYYCVVEIGSIKYIGASASTKKEAEIKAARTAMIAIKSSGDYQRVNSIYTVVPQKKKAPDVGIITQEKAKAASKPKKRRRFNKRRRGFKKDNSSGEGTIGSEMNTDGRDGMIGLGSEANTCSSGILNANLENNLVSDVSNVL